MQRIRSVPFLPSWFSKRSRKREFMRPLAILLSLLASLAVLGADAGGAADKSSLAFGTIERLDPRLDQLLPAGAKLEKLAEGFRWTEGPVWVPHEGGYLLFSDVPANTVYR